jgi:hypothetical protein
MIRLALVSMAVLVVIGATALPVRAQDASDKILYDRWAKSIEKRLEGWDYHKTKWEEGVGWLAGPMLRGLVKGYAWSGDPKWLKPLCQQIDVLMSRLKTEPIPNSSSRKAFPGWGHSITGEAIVLEAILEFVELAQTDEKMPAEYKTKAAGYLKKIDPVMITKWDEAGRWADTALDCGTYIEGISLPHNKNAHLGSMLLVAARVTPSAERRVLYLDKAARLARRWKKFLKVEKDYYLWHYWDAAGGWDFDEKGKSRHWTSLEHRGYAASDTRFVGQAFDHGLVFDRDDIEKHCRTFLKKIWNGDEENPVYRAQGWFNEKYVACTVLSGLAPYNAKIMELWAKRVEKVAEGWGGISGTPAYLLARRRGLGWKRDRADFGRTLAKTLAEKPRKKQDDAPAVPFSQTPQKD